MTNVDNGASTHKNLDLGSDKEANINMASLKSNDSSAVELAFQHTTAPNQTRYYQGISKKKQKTYPKSRPEKANNVRRSVDGVGDTAGHTTNYLMTIDRQQDGNNRVTMIQKSTVFSFNSVPDKSIEECKGLQ